MRHSAIEAMIREQYHLDKDAQVEVKFIQMIGDEYEFSVEDYVKHLDGETSVRITIIKLRYSSNITILD